jgi:uncharacterized protein (TIGR00255 family)
MISSMTGFAREAGSYGAASFAWEMKSVNGRNLDIRLRVPPGFEAVGEEVRKLVSALVTRGAVQVGLMVQRADARRVGVRINTEVLTSLAEALASLPPSLPFQPATLDGLLQVRGVVEVEDPDEQSLGGDLHPHLLACASRAADALAAARRHEGLALRDVLAAQLSRMTELVANVENHPARSAASIRARLETQLSTLMTGRENALDPDRLYQEAALLATRADVREELDRLGAHIDASRELLEQGGAIGRKLDFLAQEFGREASTLCAKANHVELSRVGLELRAIVDQFREQAQNVE